MWFEVNENQEIVAGYQKNNFEETLIFHEENLSIISEYKDGVEKHFYKLENNVITKTEHYHNFVQAELRKKRDELLLKTDWRATIDYPGDDQAAWLEYRQALRDVTKQDPENVTWPEEP